MNQDLQVFNFQGNDLRVKVINSEPWFVVSDACKVLEIANVGNAISRLDKDGIRLADVIDSLGRTQSTTVANEPNLYRLIFRSDKPEAKPFQDWVYNEVLPTIRKTGSYSINQPQPAPALPRPMFDVKFTVEVNNLSDLKRARKAIEYAEKLQRLVAGKESEKITFQMSPSNLHDLILHYVRYLTDKFEAPTIRDLTRYITHFDTDNIRQEIERMTEQGLLLEDVSGKSPRYSLI